MRFVIGVDSGGSKTRALAVALDGTPVGYAEAAGGNPFHNPDFKNAVRGAISNAAESFGIENVVHVVSGIAGFDDQSDADWAVDATTVDGLTAEQAIVNDAEVAHFGAFSGSYGVVSIQGHGSNVFAVTEDGSKVLNSNFLQYANGGAVAVAMRFHFAILTNGYKSDEESILDRLCAHWDVQSRDKLFALARRGWGLPADQARNHMAAFAKEITFAALNGSELALTVCRNAAYSIAEGITLVGQCFQGPNVPVVLSGSTVRSEAITALVTSFLDESRTKQYSIQEPDNSPLVGAALMALRQHGIKEIQINGRHVENLVHRRCETRTVVK